MAERIDALDSVRGLAAFTVVTLHALTVYPTFRYLDHSSFGWLVTRTPLVLFYAGHEAVILFFVPSGFVLALPYLSLPSTIWIMSWASAPRFRLTPAMGPVPILVAFPVIAIGAAYLMMRHVEIPSQELGRIVTRRMLAAAPSV
jgi:peptidoglycan/LPS O-acetylase OafA/YrhL